MFKLFKKNKTNNLQILAEIPSKPQPWYRLSWYGLFNQIKKYYEGKSNYKERKEQELLAIRNGLITTLKVELEKEAKAIKDTENTYVIHIDRKYKQILREVRGDKFIKGFKVLVLEPNKNYRLYDDVVLIGLKKLAYVIED